MRENHAAGRQGIPVKTAIDWADICPIVDARVESEVAAFAGGPVPTAYSRFDERTREEAHADYLKSIEPYRNRNGYEIPGEFLIVRDRER